MKPLIILALVAMTAPAFSQSIGDQVVDVTRLANPENRTIPPPRADQGTVVHMAPSGVVMSRTPREPERVGDTHFQQNSSVPVETK